MQSSKWTSDLFNTYCYIVLFRRAGASELELEIWHLYSLIKQKKYKQRDETEISILYSRIRASPEYQRFRSNGTLFRPVSNRNYRISDSLQAHQVAWIVTTRRTVSDNDHDQFNSPRELFSY